METRNLDGHKQIDYIRVKLNLQYLIKICTNYIWLSRWKKTKERLSLITQFKVTATTNGNGKVLGKIPNQRLI